MTRTSCLWTAKQ